jgi:hypothetical protein
LVPPEHCKQDVRLIAFVVTALREWMRRLCARARSIRTVGTSVERRRAHSREVADVALGERHELGDAREQPVAERRDLRGLRRRPQLGEVIVEPDDGGIARGAVRAGVEGERLVVMPSAVEDDELGELGVVDRIGDVGDVVEVVGDPGSRRGR